jgi:hypothetical protein
MHTRYEARSQAGELLGIFPGPLMDCVEDVRALVANNPGAEVRPRTTASEPCPDHPAYEANNCVRCGTASKVQFQ